MATWSAADVTALKAAIASGILTVSFSGPPARTVTYQNVTALRALLAEMIAEVETAAGTRQSYRLGATKKGFIP